MWRGRLASLDVMWCCPSLLRVGGLDEVGCSGIRMRFSVLQSRGQGGRWWILRGRKEDLQQKSGCEMSVVHSESSSAAAARRSAMALSCRFEGSLTAASRTASPTRQDIRVLARAVCTQTICCTSSVRFRGEGTALSALGFRSPPRSALSASFNSSKPRRMPITVQQATEWAGSASADQISALQSARHDNRLTADVCLKMACVSTEVIHCFVPGGSRPPVLPLPADPGLFHLNSWCTAILRNDDTKRESLRSTPSTKTALANKNAAQDPGFCRNYGHKEEIRPAEKHVPFLRVRRTSLAVFTSR